MRSTVRSLSVVLAGSAALLAVAAGVAQADPGTTPATGDIVGVGSDTSEHALTALSTAYNATGPANKLYSWDASGASPITTKAGCAPINRPNGSSAGITALIADGDAHCIDFARSSRGPRGTEAQNYAFVEFARDSLSYATATTSNVPTTLTTQALHDLYASAEGSAACMYKAYLPQAGSGTRSFFLTSIGLTEATKGTCAKDTWSGGAVQEHDSAALKGDPDALAPFSVGRAIPFAADIKVNSVDDSVNPGTTNTIATVNPQNAQSPKAGEPSVTAYDRTLYNVVRRADMDTDKYINLFSSIGWICTDAAALKQVADSGFRPSDNCGVIAS
jgi:ABC-type phosphate transport system substrate-binding protein